MLYVVHGHITLQYYQIDLIAKNNVLLYASTKVRSQQKSRTRFTNRFRQNRGTRLIIIYARAYYGLVIITWTAKDVFERRR
jgi:hypothetical protein